jgi:hypothetical protein
MQAKYYNKLTLLLLASMSIICSYLNYLTINYNFSLKQLKIYFPKNIVEL